LGVRNRVSDICKAADIDRLPSGLIILHPERDLERHVWDRSRKSLVACSLQTAIKTRHQSLDYRPMVGSVDM
jgi:hypothetical protein